jgi:membrane protein
MKKKKAESIKPKLSSIKKFIIKVWRILCKPEMAILPGQLAFFLILSLVPIITLIGYGASLFNISMDTIIEVIKDNFSSNVVNTIVPIISGQSIDYKIIIMLIVMFYFASNGASSIIITSNEVYNIKQTTWIKRRIKAIGLTLIIVLLYLFILIVPVFGSRIISTVDYFNIKSMITTVLGVMQGPISWVIIFIFIKIIFTISPDKQISSKSVNGGALFTTVGWVLTTYIYSYYISHFARYDLFYAGLSNIAVLMLWIYFLSYILVIGLSLSGTYSQEEEEELAKTGSIKSEE